jgi:hypothetical protein
MCQVQDHHSASGNRDSPGFCRVLELSVGHRAAASEGVAGEGRRCFWNGLPLTAESVLRSGGKPGPGVAVLGALRAQRDLPSLATVFSQTLSTGHGAAARVPTGLGPLFRYPRSRHGVYGR